MKFLFPGSIHEGLQDGLRQHGHETIYGQGIDWYNCMISGLSPEEWANRCARSVNMHKPDVFVLCKGIYYNNGNIWKVPNKFLWWVKSKVKCMLFLSFDCPASTPLYIHNNLLPPFDGYGTTCIGVKDLFKNSFSKKLDIFEFWLGHDHRLPKDVEINNNFVCDVVLTGTPYHKPFSAPHYTRGFGFPRRDLVKLIRDKTPEIKINLYGPDTWLQEAQGGHPSFSDIYKGWIHPDQIHVVHKSAKVCIATQLVQGYRYESGRCVWVGGAGGFLLHEDRPGIREEFGCNIMYFNTGDLNHAHKQLKIALSNKPMRDSMAQGLHKMVWDSHTWKHRAETLIRKAEEIIGRKRQKSTDGA